MALVRFAGAVAEGVADDDVAAGTDGEGAGGAAEFGTGGDGAAFGTGASEPVVGEVSGVVGRLSFLAASTGTVEGVVPAGLRGVRGDPGAAEGMPTGGVGGTDGEADIGVAVADGTSAGEGGDVDVGAGVIVSAERPAAARMATVIFLSASRAGSGMRLGGPRCSAA